MSASGTRMRSQLRGNDTGPCDIHHISSEEPTHEDRKHGADRTTRPARWPGRHTVVRRTVRDFWLAGLQNDGLESAILVGPQTRDTACSCMTRTTSCWKTTNCRSSSAGNPRVSVGGRRNPYRKSPRETSKEIRSWLTRQSPRRKRNRCAHGCRSRSRYTTSSGPL